MSFPPGVVRGNPNYPLTDVQFYFVPKGITNSVGNAGVYTYVWNKPVWARTVCFMLMGAGGGGGSGRKGAAGTIRCGGGAGAGGNATIVWFNAIEIPEVMFVDVGIGGNGGAAQASNSTNGNNGVNGGQSTVYSVANAVVSSIFAGAQGGASGSGGTSANGFGGNTLTIGLWQSTTGAAASTTGAAGSNSVNPQTPVGSYGGIGGGSGGGITTGDLESNGGPGVWPRYVDSRTSINGGATGGGNGINGSLIQPWYQSFAAGPSGSGGGSSKTATPGGQGGDGGFAAGGSGGGAALDTTTPNSGAGGRGGDGIVCIVSYG